MEKGEYKVTIGLEVHAELTTKTKMFCGSVNDSDESRPNVNICPVCMGHPGTLPVPNKEAVGFVFKFGTAIGGTLTTLIEFDRKHYFYPDIPKGYQISQFDNPLVSSGSLAGVAIKRVHLEEDTAKSSHDHDSSLVDFNRAGVPLMELVTEPVIHDAETAVRFAKELQLLLQYLGIAEANMEKGEMRVEANISISKTETLGTKVEVKNLNSFRAVERAILFEVERHKKLLSRGEEILQETRGWNEAKQETVSQRTKEDSHDYRYFPEPDIPPIQVVQYPEFREAVLKASIPELPWEKRQRLVTEFEIRATDADLYVSKVELGKFFEESISRFSDKEDIQLVSNYITSDILGFSKIDNQGGVGKISPESMYQVVSLIKEGSLSSRGAKDTLLILYQVGGDANQVAKEKGLLQSSDEGTLDLVVQDVLSENPAVVNDYKSGKVTVIQFLIGQAMKKSKGTANPAILKTLFLKALQ